MQIFKKLKNLKNKNMPINPLPAVKVAAGISAPVAGALIGGATSLIQNGLNSYAVKKQNELQKQNWLEENAYNHPKEQRKRMEEAGLNPALMYQQGSTGNAQAQKDVERNNIDISGIGNIINTFLELKKKDADIENTRQKTRSETADANMKEVEEKFYESKQEAETNILRDRETESGYNVGRGTMSPDAPIFQRYEKELEKLKQDLEIGKFRKDNTDMDYQRNKWDFERDKEDKEKYDINPKDPDNVRVVKKILMQTFGTNPEALLDILGSLFRK